MPFNSQEYHERIAQEETPQANRLAHYIFNHFKAESVTDLGCSTGFYLTLLENGYVSCIGVENDDWAVANKQNKITIQHDLTEPIRLHKADLCISLEVGEHLPTNKSLQYVDNICRATQRWVIFSAAVPGQGDGGDGSLHINCQPLHFWIKMFEHCGFVCDYLETIALHDFMQQGPHMGWFINNSMVFRRLK